MGRLESQDIKKKPIRRIEVAHSTRTDVGQVRSENQDSYGYALTKRAELFVVADGMGGAGGGATASAVAVNVILRTAIGDDGRITESSLMGSIQKAHNAIYEVSKSDAELTKMGTTVVALALVDDHAIIGHVGDSRLYMAKKGELRQLTRDHTLVQELVDSGTISKGDAENHPMAHYLTRSLSPESAARAEVYSYPYDIDLGDKFLLCCDGLYNMVENSEITQVLATPDNDSAAQTLVDLANERGGTDNITVQLVEVRGFYEDSSVVSKVEDGQVELVLSSDYRESGFNIVAVQVIESLLAQNRKELAEQAAINAKELARTAGGQKSSSRASAVDGLIFNNANPSSQDIQNHEAEYGQSPDVEANGHQVKESVSAQPTQPKLAFNVPGSAAHERATEIDPEQEKSLRILVISLSVVSLVAVLGAAIFVYRHQNKGSDPQTRSVRQATVQSPGKSSATPLVLPPLEPIAVNSVNSENSQSAPVETSPSDITATPDHSQSVPLPASDLGSEVKLPDAPTLEKGGSAGSQLPELSKLNAETKSLGLTYEPATADNSVETPEISPEEQEQLETVAEAISAASALSVPPPPELRGNSEEQQADQPINWDAEKAAREKLEPSVEALVSVAPPNTDATKPIIDESEQYALVSQKIELREKIADLDAKLGNFQLATKDQQSQKATELQEQIKGVELAMVQVQKNLDAARRRLDKWLERSEAVSNRAAAVQKLADEVSVSSVQVKRRKEAYDIASLRHVEAVELWSENPSDNDLATKMAALGRELKERQANLEATLKDAIDQSVQDARFDLTEAGVSQVDLKRRQERLNRQLGFLKAATPGLDTSKSRMELQSSLFDERTKVSVELEQLRQKISDSSELELRRKGVLKDLGNSAQK